MRRVCFLMLAVLLLFSMGGAAQPAGAEAPEMQIGISDSLVLPGQAVIISFTVPEDGNCRIRLLDEEGSEVFVAVESRPAQAGYNALYWNGTANGIAAPSGTWRMVLAMNGNTA